MDLPEINLQLDLLEPIIERIRHGCLQTDGSYICTLKAAFSKIFSFVRLAFGDEAIHQAFALNPSLRGICEDIIGLKYLSTFTSTDREKVIDLLIKQQTCDLIDRQVRFFLKVQFRSINSWSL